MKVGVLRSNFPQAGENAVWAIDLVGCTAGNKDGVKLGTILSIGTNGAQDLFEIEYVDAAGVVKRFFIPNVKDVYVVEMKPLIGTRHGVEEVLMRFDVVTLFPEIFSAVCDCGITARARMRGLWSINCWNPRDTATDLHRTIDDRPFGGGPGMVMMAEPLAQTIDAVRASGNCGRVLSFAPNGARLTDTGNRGSQRTDCACLRTL